MIPERKSGWKQPRDTIYLYCEGYSTEYYYFKRIEGTRRRAFPETKYILKPVRRDRSKMKKSSPNDVLTQLKRDKQWRELIDRCHIDTFLTKYLSAVAVTNDKLKSELYPEQKFDEDRFRPKFDRFNELKNNLHEQLTQFGVIDDKLVDIRESKKIADRFMKNEYPDYDIDFDIEKLLPLKPEGKEFYALVVDRDQFSGDRSDEMMDKIRNSCYKNNDFLIVTNPYFELWLALHTPEFDESEMEQFMRSYYHLFSSEIKTTREQRDSVGPIGYLNEHAPGYDKRLSDFPYLEQKGLERAVYNLKKFYKTDLDDVLKKISSDDFSPIGSNILDIMGN